jgi:hypothetical protein
MTHAPVDQYFPGDSAIGEFLSARRKLIVGLLALVSVITSGQLDAGLIVQGLFALLGAYGIHEVAND